MTDIETTTNGAWLRGQWTVPPYGSAQFVRWLEDTGMSDEDFRTTPMYQAAVETGLIIEDQWMPAGKHTFKAKVNSTIAAIAKSTEGELSRIQTETGRPLLDAEMGTVLLNNLSPDGAVAFSMDNLRMPKLREIKGASAPNDPSLLWAGAVRRLSPKVIDFLTSREVPRFYIKPGGKGRYAPNENALFVPSETQHQGQVQRAMYSYLHSQGQNALATTYQRNVLAYEAPLVRLLSGGYALRGPWADQEDGKIASRYSEELEKMVSAGTIITDEMALSMFGGKGGGEEYLLGMAERMTEESTEAIAISWNRAPGQLTLLYAVSSGEFL